LNARERGFLLLSSQLGDPDRKPLTTAQLRVLADRAWNLDISDLDRQLEQKDLTMLGYGPDMAQRILRLLEDAAILERYVRRGEKCGCVPITRVSEGYPLAVRRSLGLDSPGVLWAKGDLSLLGKPAVSLVGSRDLRNENRTFAAEVGRQAALQGFVLISGNARGADRTAQDACLAAGGNVISVVADELANQRCRDRVLYLSEDSFDLEFSSQRALSRNRVIHAMADRVFVAQSSLKLGGTWDGSVKNLRFGWSKLFCYEDGSEASALLQQMGATAISLLQLENLAVLEVNEKTLFDQ